MAATQFAEILERHEVRQAQLARQLGKSRAWVSRHVNGKRRWQLEDALAVTEAMTQIVGRRFTVDELFGGAA